MQIFTREQALAGLKEVFKVAGYETKLRDDYYNSFEREGQYYIFEEIDSKGKVIKRYWVHALTGVIYSPMEADMIHVSGYIPRDVVLSGKVSVPVTVSGINMLKVVFPEPFEEVPEIVITPHSEHPGTLVKGFSINKPAKDSFYICINRTSLTATTFHWMAKGKVAGQCGWSYQGED